MVHLPILIAVLPFFVFLYFLLVRKSSLLKTSLITLFAYTFLAIVYWKIVASALYASFGKGIFVAIDIFLIIFGAIFFLEILRHYKVIDNISYYLSRISKDYRVQVIIIAWFFECFLEGTAGFGVPGAVAVPILIAMGLPPIRSLILGLLGNSVPGIFGAAGTPIKVGFGNIQAVNIPHYAALFNFVGMIIPVFMLWVMTKGRKNRKKEFIEALPFAIWSGFLFVAFSFISLKLFGQEFPTILGSIFGMIAIIISIKLKIFTPKTTLTLSEEVKTEKSMGPLKAFFPYILLVVFLILGKVLLGKISFPIDLGFNYSFHLFNPGLIFLFSSLVLVLLWRMSRKSFLKSFRPAFSGAILPFFVIASMLAMVEIMKNSGINLSGIPSAIDIIAKSIEFSFLPFFAPFAGAFGAFLTGSVTASSIMFGTLFNTTALSLGFSNSIILALLVVGGGIGNMIALADILTAEAVVGQKNSELKILKGVLVPCLISLTLVAVIGMFLF